MNISSIKAGEIDYLVLLELCGLRLMVALNGWITGNLGKTKISVWFHRGLEARIKPRPELIVWLWIKWWGGIEKRGFGLRAESFF